MVLAAHRRLSFSGIFGTVASPWEEWSFRLNLGQGIGEGDPQTLLTAALAAYNTHLKPVIRPVARLQEIKYAVIAAGGLYAADPTINAVDSAGSAADSGLYPAQIAWAVSLNTELRGPRGRGRFYLPSPAKNVSEQSGLVGAADTQTVATAAASFVTALNGVAGFGNVVVASSSGVNSVVTSVRMGRALDTIRSRRRQLAESYGADVTTPSGT